MVVIHIWRMLGKTTKLKAAINTNAFPLHLRIQPLAKCRRRVNKLRAKKLSFLYKWMTCEDHTIKRTSSLNPIICGHLRGIITGQMCNHGFIYGHGNPCVRVCVHPDVMMPLLMTAFLIKPLNANEFRPSGRQLLWWPGRVTAPHPHIKIHRHLTRTFAAKMNIRRL